MRLRSVVSVAPSGGRPIGLLSFLLLLLLAGGCARTGGEDSAPDEARSESEALAEWRGCYALSVEDPDWRLPAAVALDSVPLQGWEAFSERYERVLQVRSFGERTSRSRDTPFAFWRPLEGDSITLGHPGALAGVTLRLGREEEGGRGMALAFTDAIEPGESGRDSTTVRLAPLPCDSLGPSEDAG